MDLGLMEAGRQRRVFVNNAGFGRSRESLEAQGQHPLRDIFSLTEKRLQVEWENEDVRCTETLRAMMAIVFNAPYFNKGLFFDAAMSPSDGVLNGIFVPRHSRLALLTRFLRGRFGHSLQRESDTRVDGHRIEVESQTDLFPQADGERAFGGVPVRRLEFSVLRDALQIYT